MTVHPAVFACCVVLWVGVGAVVGYAWGRARPRALAGELSRARESAWHWFGLYQTLRRRFARQAACRDAARLLGRGYRERLLADDVEGRN